MTPDELKAAMRTLNLSSAQLGALVGRHPRQVRRWMYGESKTPVLVGRFVGEMLERADP